MPAFATDYFTKVGNPGSATTLNAPGHTIGATSWTVGATTNWPTDTGVIFAVDTVTLVNGVGVRNVGSYTEWEGVVASATSVTGTVLRYGTDQDYPANSLTRVYIPVASSDRNRSVDGILISHKQDGTMITSLPLTTPNITTSINDSAGNEIIITPATASAVNEITVTNAATATDPRISASGGDTAINLNLRGKGLAKTVTIGAGATTIYPFDYVASGCIWTADNVGVNLNASGTAGVVVINGNPITVVAVTARAFTLNLDTYVDVLDNGNGTGLYVYTTAATNAASPALAANSIRIGIIQAAATITATTKVNQGQEDRVFPIASSIPYAVTDSLGNLIYPRDSLRRILGYRQIIVAFSTATSGSNVDVTGLSVPVLVPEGRKVLISVYSRSLRSSQAAGNDEVINILEGATTINLSVTNTPVSNYQHTAETKALISPTAGLHTYKVAINQSTAGTITINSGGGASTPTFIMVQLV